MYKKRNCLKMKKKITSQITTYMLKKTLGIIQYLHTDKSNIDN